MSDRDPRMLRGMSASAAAWIATIATLFFVVELFVMLGVLGVFKIAGGYKDADGLAILVILCVSFVVCAALDVIFIPFMRAKQRAELAAGYTTQYPQFNQVDGISPRTGLVVRPAVVPTASTGQPDSFTTGTEIGAIETGRTALGINIRTPSVSVTVVVSVLVLGGAPVIVFTDQNPSDLVMFTTALLWVAALIAVCFAAVAAVITVPERFYVAKLAGHFPSARAFSAVLDSSNVIQELIGEDAPALSGARTRSVGYVVVDQTRLILFSRRRSALVPYLTIPQSRIASAGSTMSTGVTNTPFPSAALSVVKDNGTHLDIILRFGATRMTQGRKTLQSYVDYLVGWARGRSTT